MEKIIDISKYVGAFMVIQAGLGFIAKPLLDDYIDNHIKTYQKQVEEKENNKQSFRSLLAPKMGVEEDEVHIELGRMYKDEQDFKKIVKSEIKYYHPSTLIK